MKKESSKKLSEKKKFIFTETSHHFSFKLYFWVLHTSPSLQLIIFLKTN